MSHFSDSKSQVGDSNVTTTMGKIKVKTGGKKEKNVEEIMQVFLEEKDGTISLTSWVRKTVLY